MFDVPILYLTYNRPEETKRTFENVLSISPAKLYIAQDGPKDEADKVRTDAVRKIIKDIPDGSKVYYLISENNVGSRKNVNAALDWFFENEEMGVIIEDDILPDPTFFPFAKKLLHRYRDDERIMLISGNNLLGRNPGEDDYFFTKVGAIWGWASWRRVWHLHDKEMKNWPNIRKDPVAEQILPKELWDRRVQNLELVIKGEIDAWDYPFTMTRLVNSGLSVIPGKNLVTNIGFNELATHTKSRPLWFSNERYAVDIEKLVHPKIIAADISFDVDVHKANYPVISFSTRLKNKIKRLLS